jgi:hypothetical protein
MNKIKEIQNVEAIDLFNDKIIIFQNKDINYEENYLTNIKINKFYSKSKTNSYLVFQEENFSDLIILNAQFKRKIHSGNFNVKNAIKIKNGLIIINKKTKTYNWIDPLNFDIIDLKFYYKKSGGFKNILFNNVGKDFKFFSIDEKNVISQFNIENDFGLSSFWKKGIIILKNIIYIPLENDQLYAINYLDKSVVWKKDAIGRFTIYKNVLYTIYNNQLKEIDNRTGKTLKETKIDKLLSYGFRPTGEIIIYDDYLFCLSTEKNGDIAVFKKDTKDFIKILQVGSIIPYGRNNLIWYNHKLFVLDINKNLHIYKFLEKKLKP